MLMADQTINIGLNVTSNGTTDNEIKKAGQLSSALKEAQRAASTTAAYKNAASVSNSSAGDSSLSRGIAGQTGAAGRDFAAQAQGLGGLVHVYATFAANIFAVSAAFSALSKAADFELMIKGMDQLGAVSGKNFGTMAKRLNEITDGAISMKAALTATAQANAAGVSADQLSRLAAVAKSASQVLGRDMTDSLDRLIRGVAKSQPELLDELGIIVHVGRAASEYAQILGKSVTSLTQFEKSQAFVIAVLKQGESKFKDISSEANPYSKLLAGVTNAAYAAGAAINTVFGPLAKLLGESPTALFSILAGLTALLISKAIPALGQWQDQLGKTAARSAETALKLKESYSDFLLQKDLGPGFAMQKQADTHKAAVQQILTQNKSLFTTDSAFYKKAFGTGAENDFKSKDVDSITAKTNAVTKELLATQVQLNKASAEGSLNKKLDLELIEKRLVKEKALLEELARQTHAQGYAAGQAPKLLDSGEANANKQAAWYSEESIRARKLAIAETAAAKARLLKALSDDSQEMGRVDAFARFRQGIKDDGSLNKLQGGILTLKGGIQSTLGYVGSLASSLGSMFMMVGIGIAVFEALDSVFSKNAKTIVEFNSALKSLNDSVDGTQRTLDFYSKNSEKQFSSAGIIAYAATFNELDGALQKVSATLQKISENGLLGKDLSTLTKNNWWDRLKEETFSLFGGGIQKNTSEAIAKTLYDALKVAGTGPQSGKLSELIQNTIAPKSNSVEGFKEALNDIKPEEFAKKLEPLVKGFEVINRAINNTASDLKEYNEAMKIATDSQDKYLQSLSNNDPLFKFGAALETAGVKLSKALQDPQNALTAIVELSKDFDKLSLLPKDSVLKLVEARKELDALQSSMTDINKRIQSAKDKVAVEQQVVNSREPKDVLQQERDRLLKAKQELSFQEKALDTQKNVAADAIGKIGNVSLQLFEAGAKKIEDSLKLAAETAAIGISKSAISGLSGSGTSEANAILAKQEIDIQIRLVNSQLDLLTSQEKLRTAIEDSTLEARIKDEKDPIKLASLQKQRAANSSFDSIVSGANATELAAKVAGLLKDTRDKDDKLVKPENIDLIGRLTTLLQRIAAGESQKAVLGARKKSEDIKAEQGTSKEDTAQQAKLLQFAAQELSIRLASLNTLKSFSPIFNQIVSDQVELTQKALDKNAIDQKSNELAEIRKQAGITAKYLNEQDLVAILAKKGYNEQYANKLKEIAIIQQQQSQAELIRIQVTAQAKLDSIIYVAAQEERIRVARDSTAQAKLDIEKNTLEILKNYGTISEGVYASELANLNKISEKINANATMRKLELDQANEMAAIELKIAAAKRTALEAGPMTPEALNADSGVAAALANKDLVAGRQVEERSSTEALIAAKQKIAAVNAVIAQQQGELNELMKVQAGIVDSLTLSFGNFGTAIGGVLTAFSEGLKRNVELTSGYSIQLKQIEEDKKSALDKADSIEDPSSYLEAKAKAEEDAAKKIADAKKKYTKDSTDNELASIAKGTNALKKSFSEKTAAYKILDAIEKAASAERLVRQAMEFAASVPKFITEMSLLGGKAVLNQGGGDVYTAIPRMAAMAALVATVMSAFGGGGAPSISGASQKEIDEVKAENVQKTQNRGGVLGDSSATSNSIKNGIEELTKNSFSDLDYTQAMLRSLKSIDKGISAFGVAVARATGIQGDGPSKFGVVDGNSTTSGSKGFLGLFGKSTTVTTDILDTGVRLTGTIGDFLKGVGQIVQYEKDLITTTTTKSGFLGIGGGTSTNKQITEQTAVLEDTTQKLVSKIIGGMVVSISEAFKLLQLPTENLVDLLSGVDVTGLAASLKGLSGQDASDAIDAFFSNIFDTMSSKVAPWLGEFQKVGESLGDTLVRVASDTRTIDYAFIALGSTTKDAAKAAEAAGVTLEKWVISQIQANEALIDLAGGLDEFVSKMDYITQNFLTESKKLAPVRKALTEAFSATGALGKELAKVGLDTPKTREQFVTLLTTLRDMGAEGNAASAALLDIAPAFNKIQGAIEDAIDSIGTRISELKFQMMLDTLDTQGKYALINKTAGEDYAKYMEAVKDKSVSAVDAAKLANKLIDRIQQGWNLLTTEQRQEAQVREKYFTRLDDINASIIEKGGAELLGLSDDAISQINAIETGTDRIVAAITGNTTATVKAAALPKKNMPDTISTAISESNTMALDAIAKAMNSSNQEMYGVTSGLSASDVQVLVDETRAAPNKFAVAMASTPLVIPPVDISGIQNSVEDLKNTVATMLAVLTEKAVAPVNLNVNVQSPRNQEVGVSLA